MDAYLLAGGLLAFADLWAIVRTVRSDVGRSRKLKWVLMVVFLPVLGVVLWILSGPS